MSELVSREVIVSSQIRDYMTAQENLAKNQRLGLILMILQFYSQANKITIDFTQNIEEQIQSEIRENKNKYSPRFNLFFAKIL